ncbi:MAG: PilZ domain-containing protein [Proteobacteria bacterium]|nr:PilZ domain-containing protein [Pseudomonadota bacterium]
MELGLNRRSSLRIQAVGHVLLTLDGQTFDGVPIDVSAGGARVRLQFGDAQRLPWPGARLRLDFIRKLGRPAFTVDCLVVRVSPDGRDYSLKFELDDLTGARLAKFLELEANELGIPVSELGEVVVLKAAAANTAPRPIAAPDHGSYVLVGWLAFAAAVGAIVAVVAF